MQRMVYLDGVLVAWQVDDDDVYWLFTTGKHVIQMIALLTNLAYMILLLFPSTPGVGELFWVLPQNIFVYNDITP
jgi:hypothetical protein